MPGKKGKMLPGKQKKFLGNLKYFIPDPAQEVTEQCFRDDIILAKCTM